MKILKILGSALFCTAGLAAWGASAKANIIPVADPYFDQFPAGPTNLNGLMVGPGTPYPYLYLSCGGTCRFTDANVVGWTSSGTYDEAHGIVSGQWQIGDQTDFFNGPPIIAGTSTPEPIVVRDINATISQVVSTTALAGVTYTLDVDLGFNLGPRQDLGDVCWSSGPSVAGGDPAAVRRPDAGADAGQRQLVRFSDYLHRDQRGRWRSDRDPAFVLDRQRHADSMVRRCPVDGLPVFCEPVRRRACDSGDAAARLQRNGRRCWCSPLIATAKRSRPARLTAKTGCFAGEWARQTAAPPNFCV